MSDRIGGSRRPDQEVIFAELEWRARNSGGHTVNSRMTVCYGDIRNG